MLIGLNQEQLKTKKEGSDQEMVKLIKYTLCKEMIPLGGCTPNQLQPASDARLCLMVASIRDKTESNTKYSKHVRSSDPLKFTSVQTWQWCPQCIHLKVHPWINPYIHPSIHPFIIQLPIHPLSNHPFIHSVKQPSSQPTHTPLIHWLTLHWTDRYSLKLHRCKCLGTMARHCLCS